MDLPNRSTRRRGVTSNEAHSKKLKVPRNICLICSKFNPAEHFCKCKTGILNIGNSCYMNSVFQALAELKIPLSLPQTSDFSLLYQKLGEYSLEPLCFSPVLSEIAEIWEHRNHQEDAHEFFTAILSICDSSKFDFEVNTRLICLRCSNVGVDCTKQDNTFHMVLDGSPLQQQITRSEEEIEAACSVCGYHLQVFAKTIARGPEVLAVKMNRFQFNQKTGRAKKIRNRSELPQKLLVAEQDMELNTVIMHKGGAMSHGHYVTYIHAKDIEIDDDRVVYGQKFHLDYSYFYIAFYSNNS